LAVEWCWWWWWWGERQPFQRIKLVLKRRTGAAARAKASTREKSSWESFSHLGSGWKCSKMKEGGGTGSSIWGIYVYVVAWSMCPPAASVLIPTDKAHSQRVCGLHTGDASHFLKKDAAVPGRPQRGFYLTRYIHCVCGANHLPCVCCAGEKSSQ
jgi:hypothetical protein